MSAEEPFAVLRAKKRVNAVALRSMFIAGFSYYEIGRNGYARFHDPAYLSYMTIAFASAVLCSALSSYVWYYISLLDDGEKKYRFVCMAEPFIRHTIRLFQLALLSYGIGVSRVGWVYFADSSTRWLPMSIVVAGGVCLLLMFVFMWKQHGIAKLKEVQPASEVVWTPNAAFAGPDPAVANHVTPNRFRMEPAWKGLKSAKSHEFLVLQARTLADRAIFIIGFSQSGVSRFIATTSGTGFAYLFFVSVACVLAIVSGFALTALIIFVEDFETEEYKEAFAQRSMVIWRTCSGMFFLSLFCLMFSLVFMGYGCGFPGEAYIPVAAGSVGLALILTGMVLGDRAYVYSTSLPESPSDDDESHSLAYAPLLASANAIAFPATVSAGFVFYNVETYSTDILPIGDGHWARTFLAVNAVTFCLGIVSVTFSTLIAVWIQDLPRKVQKAALASRVDAIGRFCFLTFQGSFFCFLVGFGLFGVTKFNPVKLEPMIIAGVGLCFTLVGFGVIIKAARNSRKLALAVYGPSTLSLRAVTTFPSAVVSPVAPPNARQSSSPAADISYDAVMTQLNEFSGRSLFFGGFAYFAVNFLFTSYRPVSSAYLVFMSLSFTLACIGILWAMFATLWGESLSSAQQKRGFAKGIQPLANLAFFIFLGAIFSFFAGFSVIGWVRVETSLAEVMAVGGGVGMVLCLSLVIHIRSVWLRVSRILEADIPASSAQFPTSRMVAELGVTALQCSFVAGNVFYEILFSAFGRFTGPNYLYFQFGTATLVCGATVTACATAVSVYVNHLASDARKGEMCSQLLPLKTILAQLYNAAQACWLLSLALMGVVKYFDDWKISFVIGCTALGYFSVMVSRFRLFWWRCNHSISLSDSWGLADTVFRNWFDSPRPVGAAHITLCCVVFGSIIAGFTLLVMYV